MISSQDHITNTMNAPSHHHHHNHLHPHISDAHFDLSGEYPASAAPVMVMGSRLIPCDPADFLLVHDIHDPADDHHVGSDANHFAVARSDALADDIIKSADDGNIDDELAATDHDDRPDADNLIGDAGAGLSSMANYIIMDHVLNSDDNCNYVVDDHDNTLFNLMDAEELIYGSNYIEMMGNLGDAGLNIKDPNGANSCSSDPSNIYVGAGPNLISRVDHIQKTRISHTIKGSYTVGLQQRMANKSVNLIDELVNDINTHPKKPVMMTTKKMKKKIKKKKKKNLVAERRRRQMFNEKLYSLTSLIPTITKMDKVSIIRDAAQYLQDLQADVAHGEADVAVMVAAMQRATSSNYMDIATAKTRQLEHLIGSHPLTTLLMDDYNIVPSHPTSNFSSFQPCEITMIQVTQIKKQLYHIRIHCKNEENVLVQLCRAVEAVDINVLTANISSHGKNILQTLTIEVKNKLLKTIEEVRRMIIDAVYIFGFQLQC